MYACRSSNARALVVLSFFDKFLKYTTALESEMVERSGGSVTWDSCDELVPNAGVDEDPKADPNVLVAARALLACAFACRLLMMKVYKDQKPRDQKERHQVRERKGKKGAQACVR